MTLRFWIRVNARLHDDPDVREFARVLFPRRAVRDAVNTTCGLLLALWGRMIDEQEDGNLSRRDDDTIEEWARWDGKRGAFGEAFRARFIDDGHLKEWKEYQGALIERRDKDRKRKRKGSHAPQEAPQEFQRNEDGTPRPNDNNNEHGNGTAVLVVWGADPETSLAVWINSAIAETHGEQPTPIRRHQCTQLAADVAHVDAAVVRESIYAQVRKKNSPPSHGNYFRAGILSAWDAERTRRAVASSGEQPPAIRVTNGARSTKSERVMSVLADYANEESNGQ